MPVSEIILLGKGMGLTMIEDRELVRLAMEMRARAYAPYSGFSVGAALLCSDGSVYCGCNVENSSYGGTICAERVAAVSAVAGGHRDFIKIAVSGSGDGYCMPCGICRQFLSEFSRSMVFLCVDKQGGWKELRFEDLMPNRFEL